MAENYLPKCPPVAPPPSDTAQVQLKSDFTRQSLVAVSSTVAADTNSRRPLAADSVRVRTTILAMSINNSAYAISGTFLSWWDTFPVPEDYREPYNDRARYGIFCGWEFATVLDNTRNGIKMGTLLRGYFFFSSIPVDLLLTPAQTPVHFIVKSSHRAKVMDLYQRYIVSGKVSGRSSSVVSRKAYNALVGVLWKCSYLLNRFGFTPAPPIINPAGDDLPWTMKQADLRNTTIVALGIDFVRAKSVLMRALW